MTQADGVHILEKIEITHGASSYKFRVNPESINYSYPQRIAVNKTQSKIVLQDFNADVQEVELSGTTGSAQNGAEKAINDLRNFLSNYSGTPLNYGNKPKNPIIFYNHTEDFAWYVTVKDYSIKRSAEKPTMWDYTIQFYVLAPAGGKVSSPLAKNEVSSWLYNKKRYTSSIGKNLYTPVNYAYINSNVATGKDAGSVMAKSNTGKTRAMKTLGVR